MNADNNRRCIKCGEPLCRKRRESQRDWAARQFCKRACYLGNRSAKPIWKTFAEKTERNANGCIEWTGYTDRKGYGRFSSAGGEVLAHRLAYMMHYGKPVTGLHILHRCDNPKCCNPQHLFAGTNQDNMDDKKRKGRTKRLYGKENPNYRHGRNCASPKAAEIARIRAERANA